METYAANANWWKIAQLIVGCGLAYIVFVIDRKILGFKFKGIFAYIIIAGSIIMIIWPVSTKDDFAAMSSMSILPQLGMFVVFFVFLNIARKSSGRVRKTAVIIILAFVLYTVAALLVNAGLVSAIQIAFGESAAIYPYILQSIFKTAGVIMMAVGASRWGN
jgi:small-conductance mechanosensitive channel